MYRDSARYYDAIYSFKDYAAEAAFVTARIRERKPDAATLLDVACGTGAHLVHLARSFRIAGVDLSKEQLAVARTRLPDAELHQGDMLTLDLGERFDAVTCMFSSIGYAGSTTDRLDQAVARMAAHLNPGGVLVVEPWLQPDLFEDGHLSTLFVDEPDIAIARMSIAHKDGRRSWFDMEHLVGTTDGIEHFTEHHELGLFTVEEHTATFERAGLRVEHDPDGPIGRGLYVGVAG
jgi:ubiquinone/menaquinone biosynthesis C-methylase UbiE